MAEELRRKHLLCLAIVASVEFLQSSLVALTESDSSDEESGRILAKRHARLRGARRTCCRVKDYVERTVPGLLNKEFREHFRLVPETFDLLEARLAPLLAKSSDDGRPTIPVRKQLLSTLWLLATPDSYRSVADRFNMGKSSLSDVFMRVVQCLNDVADSVIVWPKEDQVQVVKDAFRRIGTLPDVIGAIDGTDIEIKAPKVDSHFYKTRKRRYAIILQAVCDAELRFTDCFAGFAGSVGDLRVLRNSDLWKEVRRRPTVFFPAQEYIIGDKAYPCLTWIIPSFRNLGNLTPAQLKFNKVHAKMRQVIERAFALLKGRWRRLKHLDMNRDDMIPFTILACCVLHNLCLNGVPDDCEDFIAEGQDGDDDEDNESVEEPQVCHAVQAHNDHLGLAKRNYLVTVVQ